MRPTKALADARSALDCSPSIRDRTKKADLTVRDERMEARPTLRAEDNKLDVKAVSFGIKVWIRITKHAVRKG